MLTKDLLRTRTAGQNIHPLFIDPEDRKLLTFSSALIGIYSNAIGSTMDELNTQCMPELQTVKDLKLAKGILKTVNCYAEFSSNKQVEYPPLRQRILQHAAELLQQGKLPENPLDVRSAVLESLEHEPDTADCVRLFSETPLYADLPENDHLDNFKKVFAKDILHRYNISLVQTLLLYCKKLECTLYLSEEPGQLRRLFKYLKFFRLLFRAELRNDRLFLQIDGPASILENSNKYGFQMACFFPALCLLQRWELQCKIQGLSKTDKNLHLSQDNHLHSHFNHYSAYLPEEIKMFAELFARKQQDWQLDDAPGYLNPEGQQLIFPDFMFTHRQSGESFYLELFHRWHAGQLEERLHFCLEHPDSRLLLGIDRTLLKKDDSLKQRLESDPRLEHCTFLFRDFPGVSHTLELLKKQIHQQQTVQQEIPLF